jgi:hypothetical protein
MTRRGNHTLFLRDPDVRPSEHALLVRSLELARQGALRGAVPLASPIRHQRVHGYAREERKEG